MPSEDVRRTSSAGSMRTSGRMQNITACRKSSRKTSARALLWHSPSGEPVRPHRKEWPEAGVTLCRSGSGITRSSLLLLPCAWGAECNWPYISYMHAYRRVRNEKRPWHRRVVIDTLNAPARQSVVLDKNEYGFYARPPN